MTTPKTFIVNVETGEEIVREYNDDELAQQEIDVATQKAKMEAEAQAKANKEAAQLKLETLGLTADDLKAVYKGRWIALVRILLQLGLSHCRR
jgi:hypothetical protein